MSDPASTSTSQSQAPVPSWQARLAEHCSFRGLGTPAYSDVSDRRGGRPACSAIVTINGTQYQARFWYEENNAKGARDDAAEFALRSMTGTLNTSQQPPPASFYAPGTVRQDNVAPAEEGE